jgi:hypothetical protein
MCIASLVVSVYNTTAKHEPLANCHLVFTGAPVGAGSLSRLVMKEGRRTQGPGLQSVARRSSQGASSNSEVPNHDPCVLTGKRQRLSQLQSHASHG